MFSGRQHWSARGPPHLAAARERKLPRKQALRQRGPDASARFVGDRVDGAVVPAPHILWLWLPSRTYSKHFENLHGVL